MLKPNRELRGVKMRKRNRLFFNWQRLAISLSVLGLALSTTAQARQPGPPSAGARRIQESLRDLNSYFPFKVPESLDAWETRKRKLRKHLLVTQGLWPLPPAPESRPVVHGLIDQGDYTIEMVFFESLPGFFVTGNLYRPKIITGRIPGILSPHGHHRSGRFLHATDEEIDKQIAKGAETFRSNARSVLQARCANLAKMGCVVFHYDMIGYADSRQLSNGLIHGFRKQRASMTDAESWGLFSPQAESNLQTAMGLQTLNSIRSLDFLASLPEVDSKRLGVTGCSGGGTQTFMLCAIDDRPAAAFPAVMVSTAMQGGCTCENCSYLRIGTGNVEIAAMFAPKPLGLTAANDWTKEMESKGFPELQGLYELYGKKENVQLTSRTEFEHNFNQVSREAMYRWFKRHLDFTGEPVETEIEFVEPTALSVFNDRYPVPEGGDEFERNLISYLTRQSSAQLQRQLLDHDSTLEDFEDGIGTFVDVIGDAAAATLGECRTERVQATQEIPGVNRFSLRFSNGWTSSLLHHGPDEAGLLFVGKLDASVFESNADALSRLIHDCRELGLGASIVQHDSLTDADRVRSRQVDNSREALAYTTCYNAPQIAKRAYAWASAIAHDKVRRYVIATGTPAMEVALNAKQLSGEEKVKGIVVKTDGIRFQRIDNIRDPNLLPGAAKYIDLPGLLSLAAPKPMLVIGEDEQSAKLVVRAYELAGKPGNLTLIKDVPDGESENDLILEWLKSVEKQN